MSAQTRMARRRPTVRDGLARDYGRAERHHGVLVPLVGRDTGEEVPHVVLYRCPDVLIVDDTDIVYEGWVTRERRIASLIGERPVFILRLGDADLQRTRATFRIEPFLGVQIAVGGPSAVVARQVFRVEPLDPTGCGR